MWIRCRVVPGLLKAESSKADSSMCARTPGEACMGGFARMQKSRRIRSFSDC